MPGTPGYAMVGKLNTSKALAVLAPLLTESRRQKIISVVSSRTRSLGVLLENVIDIGNENAVVRSMDAFGVLNLHRIATVSPRRKANCTQVRTDVGSRQWLEIKNWSNLANCVSTLKENGYRIASTSPSNSLDIAEIDFSKKTVIAFGNEKCGVSEELTKLSDLQFSLPMCGFVPSFNISVSVAVVLYHAYTQRVLTRVSMNVHPI